MDLDMNHAGLALALILLALAGLFALIRTVFTSVYRFEESDGELEEQIHKLFENEHYSEIVALGHLICSTGFVLLSAELYSSWKCVLVAFGLLYLVAHFLPAVAGSLWPNTLSGFCLWTYRTLRWIFVVPAKVSGGLARGIMKLFGHNAQYRFLTEAQRGAIQEDALDNGEGLEEEERQMIQNIFEFADTPVREIMTPRVEMHAISVDTPLEDVIRALNNERHSRLPVYRGTIDSVMGILSNREFLEWYTEHKDEPFDLEKLALPAMFVPPTKKIDDLLRELRSANSHLAIVVDEYGGTAGLVTMEDILEEIVGEIRDEDDEEEEDEVQKLQNGEYRLDPLITLSDLEDELGVELPPPEDGHVETLSGLLQSSLGAIPKEGDEIRIGAWCFKVLRMEGTRMEEVLMSQRGEAA
jgi:CBS domain containing-hemolysin-like protein